MTISRLPRNFTALAVPLVLIASIAEFRGFAVGDLHTFAAVVLAAIFVTVAEHLLDRPLKFFLGEDRRSLHYWAALSAVNVVVSLVSLVVAGII
jgi:hypothetical protein